MNINRLIEQLEELKKTGYGLRSVVVVRHGTGNRAGAEYVHPLISVEHLNNDEVALHLGYGELN